MKCDRLEEAFGWILIGQYKHPCLASLVLHFQASRAFVQSYCLKYNYKSLSERFTMVTTATEDNYCFVLSQIAYMYTCALNIIQLHSVLTKFFFKVVKEEHRI